jgi:hypothetical protein
VGLVGSMNNSLIRQSSKGIPLKINDLYFSFFRIYIKLFIIRYLYLTKYYKVVIFISRKARRHHV